MAFLELTSGTHRITVCSESFQGLPPITSYFSFAFTRKMTRLGVEWTILDRVAQLVEHLTFNQAVLGSSPNAIIHGWRIDACYSRQLERWPTSPMG